MFSVLTHVDTSGELISVGSWVSPPVSPEKPLRSEHRLCWWPGGPPGEPPRPGGSEQEGRSEPRGFTPARGQRCCHWAAGGRALSGVATRWALKEACRLEVGRGCCGGRGSWERRAFVGCGAGARPRPFCGASPVNGCGCGCSSAPVLEAGGASPFPVHLVPSLKTDLGHSSVCSPEAAVSGPPSRW